MTHTIAFDPNHPELFLDLAVPTDRPPTLPRSESTKALPMRPRPGASLVPRANTTSISGQASACACGAGVRSSEPTAVAAAAMSTELRRTRSMRTPNDNAKAS